MMFIDIRQGYAYERRGNRCVGFCDDGCKAEWFATMRELHRGMGIHIARHHGQLTLDYDPPRRLKPDDPPGF